MSIIQIYINLNFGLNLNIVSSAPELKSDSNFSLLKVQFICKLIEFKTTGDVII